MLKVLRSEVQKNRDALNRVQRESEEKLRRMREIDVALSEPPVGKVPAQRAKSKEDAAHLCTYFKRLLVTCADADNDANE
eukprot:3857761-Amphidinium_carterae.1